MTFYWRIKIMKKHSAVGGGSGKTVSIKPLIMFLGLFIKCVERNNGFKMR